MGGPYAGKAAACFEQKLVVKRYNVKILDGPSEVSAIEEFTYNWHHTGAQGFWIPEGQTLHDAINTLAVAYIEACEKADSHEHTPGRR